MGGPEPKVDLSDEQLRRYSRHILLPEIGIEGVTAAKPYEPSTELVQRWVKALQDADKNQDFERIRAILTGAIPEFGGGEGKVTSVSAKVGTG